MKFRALVSKTLPGCGISIDVLEIVEDSQYRFPKGRYTIFRSYLDHDVELGDELLIVTFWSDEESRMVWNSEILSKDNHLVMMTKEVELARKRLADHRRALKIALKNRMREVER